MYIVGELKDQKMVLEIISGLKNIGIEAVYHHNLEQDIYVITLPTEEFINEARDFYRVKLGFQKPIKIDQEWVKIKKLPRGESTYVMIIISIVIYLLSFSNILDKTL